MCRLLAAAALLLLSIVPTVTEVVTSISECNEYFLDGAAPNIPGILEGGNILDQNRYKAICQTWNNTRRFVTLYDTENKIPVFSAYRYQGGNTTGRPTKWKIEPQLENENGSNSMAQTGEQYYNHQASSYNYRRQKYSKGHLLPNSYAPTWDDKESTFTLTNAVPQVQTFNMKSWNKMENCVKCVLDEFCTNNNNQTEAYLVIGAQPGDIKINKVVNVPSVMWSAFCCWSRSEGRWLAGAHWGQNVEENVKDKRLETKTLDELYRELRGRAQIFPTPQYKCPLDTTVSHLYPNLNEECKCPPHISTTSAPPTTTATATTAEPSTSPASTSRPPPTTSGPFSTSPPPTTSGHLSTSPPPTTSAPLSTSPPPTTSGPLSTSPPPTTSGPLSTSPPPTTSGPVSTSPPPTTSGPLSTSAPPTTSGPLSTSPPPTTSGPYSTTSGPLSTSPPPTTSGPYRTTSGPLSTSAPPTTSGPFSTTSAPLSTSPPPTTSGPLSTSPPPTTSGPYSTTSGPPTTTPPPTTSGSTPPTSTTSGPLSTSPPPTTSGPLSTSPPPTTSGPLSTSPPPTTSGPPTTSPPPTTSGSTPPTSTTSAPSTTATTTPYTTTTKSTTTKKKNDDDENENDENSEQSGDPIQSLQSIPNSLAGGALGGLLALQAAFLGLLGILRTAFIPVVASPPRVDSATTTTQSAAISIKPSPATRIVSTVAQTAHSTPRGKPVTSKSTHQPTVAPSSTLPAEYTTREPSTPPAYTPLSPSTTPVHFSASPPPTTSGAFCTSPPPTTSGPLSTSPPPLTTSGPSTSLCPHQVPDYRQFRYFCRVHNHPYVHKCCYPYLRKIYRKKSNVFGYYQML